MYLSNRHLFFILAPMLFGGFIFLFEAEISGIIKGLFIDTARYSNKEMESKVELYIDIDQKYQEYKSYEEKIAARAKNIDFIVDNILYAKEVKEIVPIEAPELPKVEEKQKIIDYRLELIFPVDKVAIINGVIVREGMKIDDTKILSIKEDSVLIENKEGRKWLYLFK